MISVGPQGLLNIPMYSSKEEKDFGLLEASANYIGVYGKVLMGLFPTGFSYQGRLKENERFFTEAYIHKKIDTTQRLRIDLLN